MLILDHTVHKTKKIGNKRRPRRVYNMKDKNINKFFKLFIKPVLKEQIVAFICLLIFTVANVIFPYFLKLIIDEALQKKNLKLLFIYSGAMLITSLLILIFNYLQSIKFERLSQVIVSNMKQYMLTKLMTYSYNFYSKYSTGEITSIIEQDISSIQELSTQVISDVLVSFFTALGLLIILFSMDYHIGIIAVLLTLIFVFIQNKLGKLVKVKTTDLREKISNRYSLTHEIVSGINFIQILKCESIFKKAYKKIQEEYIKSDMSFSSTRIYSSSVGMGFNCIGIVMVLIIGGYKVLNNLMSVGELFTLTIYVQRVYSPIIKLLNTYITLEQSKSILNRIFHLMESPEVVQDGTIELNTTLNGSIDFVDVNFKYGDKTILNNISFNIKPGEVIGLIGENGSGKTSITRILTRLCPVNSGEILIDGKSIEQYKLHYLREQVGYMTQKFFMFKGTIRENLTLSNKNISDYEINAALEVVCFKNDIEKMPNGLNTLIGENGNNLSGGQVQKIALARIILKDPSIIILDEPTSAMDVEAEKFLVTSLNKLFKNKTILIISHREEILKICSRIFKLSNSNIYEQETIVALGGFNNGN